MFQDLENISQCSLRFWRATVTVVKLWVLRSKRYNLAVIITSNARDPVEQAKTVYMLLESVKKNMVKFGHGNGNENLRDTMRNLI